LPDPRLTIFLADLGRVAYGLSVNRKLGYLFERFPAFTQTFCAREIAELYRQGVKPPIYSIRRPVEEPPANIPLDNIPIYYLPDTNSLRFKLKTKLIPSRLKILWSGSGDIRDKGRFREAAYLGPRLRRDGVSHLHVHFAGLASRTAWWIRRLYGITYSFTGHANDIFCPKPNQRVSFEELVRDASFIVTVSDFGVGWLSGRFPASAQKVHRIYNGLDLSLFKPAGPITEPLQLVSIGRLIEKKGFPYLVEACDVLRGKDLKFRCLIIGDGPEHGRLEDLIQQYRLSDVVQLTGSLPQTELATILAKSSIFVFPAIRDRSGDSDNLPTVLVEAIASALPVVATDLAGIPEIVHQNENGFLVPEKNPDQLADAISRIAADVQLSSRFRGASRRIAEEKFALSRTVGRLRALFAEYGLDV